jgi:acyl-coenzyme A synthetase/AMP-(fatty) acid ligase
VVATPDATRGFVPKAFVVLRHGFEATDALVKELQDHVKKELAPYKYPRQVAFVPALPRTETGKIRRVELRQQEAGHALEP